MIPSPRGPRPLSAVVVLAMIFTASFTAGAGEITAALMKGDGLKMLKRGSRVLIPTVYSENLIAGVHKTSRGGAHAKATVANSGITPGLGTKIADELQADLVSKLKAAGCEVLTYEDVKDNPVVAKLKEWPADQKHHVPLASINVGYGNHDFLVSTPTGVPVQEHSSRAIFDPMAAMRYAKVAKEKDAIIVVPTYRFESPVIYGSTRGSLSKSYASVGVEPAMQIPWAGFQLLSAKGAWGSYTTDPGKPVTLSAEIGTITETSSSKSSDTSLFDFSTFRSMAKGGYVMDVDVDAYEAAAIAAGKELNTLFVAQFK